jgi:hypothetical protein
MFSGKYEPKLYAYYSSYSSATVRETARGGSILKSPTLLIGGLGFAVAVAWFAFGGWLSGAKPAPAAPVAKLPLPPPPPLPVPHAAQSVAPVPVVVPPVVHPVRIQGGMSTIRDGKMEWLWVSDEGHLMTEDEIAAESGGTVSSRLVRGVRVLSGTGVLYGGTRSEPALVSGLVPSSPAESPARDHALSTAAGEPPAATAGPGRADPLATPPGLLASPPGLVATPPDLR